MLGMGYVLALDQRHDMPRDALTRLAGGKAANLAVMSAELCLPVPPGFVISTEACRSYFANGWPEGLDEEIRAHMHRVEELTGRYFGGSAAPLLVSVRSGAPVSMPGMMDTILDLGINDGTAPGLTEMTGDLSFAADCQNRFAQLYRSVVGREPPSGEWEQLRGAVEAVFRSWNSERARAYRKVEDIPDDLGTAVTVQAMVFGNAGRGSATGVVFTRNPATGERALFGDVLFQAQGEEVVSGTRQTLPIAALEERMPAVAEQLRRYADLLERHFTDMCDIEFTIERGRLWLLQVRSGKRSPQAALRIAVDMAADPEFPLSREAAVRRVLPYLADPPKQWPGAPRDQDPIATGLPASPGLAAGEIVTSTASAAAAADVGRPHILVRAETSPEDVPAMARAAGVLTSLGGLASHAAVVARGWGVPAVVGAADIKVRPGEAVMGGTRYLEGNTITVDGSTGRVYSGVVHGEGQPMAEAQTLLRWARDAGIEPVTSTDGMAGTPEVMTPAAAPAGRDDLIRALAIKGACSAEQLADAVFSQADALGALVQELAAAGLVVSRGSALKLTDLGQVAAASLLEADRARCGPDRALAALDGFIPLDQQVKATVTAWQLRDLAGQQVVNDHTDAAYDAAVLADLAAAHTKVAGWLASVDDASGRLAAYQRRLARAAGAIAAGDSRFVASPRVDSYHSVWFELHEELIRLAGRSRADEVASGRA
jgi:pyruvate,orthophosphate dikinase